MKVLYSKCDNDGAISAFLFFKFSRCDSKDTPLLSLRPGPVNVYGGLYVRMSLREQLESVKCQTVSKVSLSHTFHNY